METWKRVGADNFGRPMFKDEKGVFYCDVNCGKGSPEYCTKYYNEFNGEPDCPIRSYRYGEIIIEGTTPGKQWMELYTAELDKLETILLEWLYSHQGKESSENRFLCRKILDAIREKDEAWLVY